MPARIWPGFPGRSRRGSGLVRAFRRTRATKRFGSAGASTLRFLCARRVLERRGYPPEKQEKATPTVLEQAEVLSEAWAAA